MIGLSPHARRIAELIDRWSEGTPLTRVYFYGSQVRGDYRPDSDVDVAIDLNDLPLTMEATVWWQNVNASDFAELKDSLSPLRLSISRSDDRGSDWLAIWFAAKEPIAIVGKVWCLATLIKFARLEPSGVRF